MNAVEVGEPVIVNDIDQPCAFLVAVVVRVEGRECWCKYLAADSALSKYNRNGGMRCKCSAVTPLSRFGVRLVVSAKAERYWCESVEESAATYEDGKPRRWQEKQPALIDIRKSVAAYLWRTGQ